MGLAYHGSWLIRLAALVYAYRISRSLRTVEEDAFLSWGLMKIAYVRVRPPTGKQGRLAAWWAEVRSTPGRGASAVPKLKDRLLRTQPAVRAARALQPPRRRWEQLVGRLDRWLAEEAPAEPPAAGEPTAAGRDADGG